MFACTLSGVRRVLGMALVVGIVLGFAGQAQARRRHSHPSSELHFGFYQAWPYYYAWPPYYWAPYYAWPPAYPYYYDDYGSYPDPAYAPSERRRFPVPVFRLPGLFHYPGALAKGERIGGAAEQPGAMTPPGNPKATTP